METLTLPRLLGRMWGVASDVASALIGLAVVAVIAVVVIDVAPSVISAGRDFMASVEQGWAAAEPSDERKLRDLVAGPPPLGDALASADELPRPSCCSCGCGGRRVAHSAAHARSAHARRAVRPMTSEAATLAYLQGQRQAAYDAWAREAHP
jgi:hypothetical protein